MMISSEFARWINPVLKALSELGGSARPREVVELVARNERVADAVLDQVNPAGGQRFPNQIHWARFYLAEAGFIDRSRHGVWKLTEKGATIGQLDEASIKALIEEVLEHTGRVRVTGQTPVQVEQETTTRSAPALEAARLDSGTTDLSVDCLLYT